MPRPVLFEGKVSVRGLYRLGGSLDCIIYFSKGISWAFRWRFCRVYVYGDSGVGTGYPGGDQKDDIPTGCFL